MAIMTIDHHVDGPAAADAGLAGDLLPDLLLRLFCRSRLQPDPGGASRGGHPGRPDQTLPGHEQRRLPLHFGGSPLLILRHAPTWSAGRLEP